MPELGSWLSFDDIVGQAALRLRDGSLNETMRQSYRMLASQGNREFARRTETVRDTYNTVVATDTASYALPTNVMRVKRVLFQDPNRNALEQLAWVEEARLLDGYSEARTGIPRVWYLSHNRSKISLYPIPDSSVNGGALIVDYVRDGNGFERVPEEGTVTGTPTTLTTFELSGLQVKPDNYWIGAQALVRSGAMIGHRFLVTDFVTSGTFTVSPQMPVALSAGDTVEVCDVPNTPAAFHHTLVDYIVWKLKGRKDGIGSDAERAWFIALEEARRYDRPDQRDEFHRVREVRRDYEGFDI